MKKISNYSDILKICTALGSKTRLEIINEIKKKPNINLNELAEKLKLTNGALTSHIKMLSDLDIVQVNVISAKRGAQKVCSLNNILFLIDLFKNEYNNNSYEENIPIGLFTNFYTNSNCGLISQNKIIGEINEPKYFSSSDRLNSNLIWLSNGYLEYSIPNLIEEKQTITEIQISLELSTAINSKNDLSKIDLTLNDKSIGCFNIDCIQDNIKGLYSPEWWNFKSFGKLFVIKINSNGVFLNDMKISDVDISQINIVNNQKINFTINCDNNGVAIFGNNFGNYNQDIKVKVSFDE